MLSQQPFKDGENNKSGVIMTAVFLLNMACKQNTHKSINMLKFRKSKTAQ